jgi:hypothetical protein
MRKQRKPAKKRAQTRKSRQRREHKATRTKRLKPVPITTKAAALHMVRGGMPMTDEELASYMQNEIGHTSLDPEMVRCLKRSMRKGGIEGIKAIAMLREMQRETSPDAAKTVEVTLQVG